MKKRLIGLMLGVAMVVGFSTTALAGGSQTGWQNAPFYGEMYDEPEGWAQRRYYGKQNINDAYSATVQSHILSVPNQPHTYKIKGTDFGVIFNSCKGVPIASHSMRFYMELVECDGKGNRDELVKIYEAPINHGKIQNFSLTKTFTSGTIEDHNDAEFCLAVEGYSNVQGCGYLYYDNPYAHTTHIPFQYNIKCVK